MKIAREGQEGDCSPTVVVRCLYGFVGSGHRAFFRFACGTPWLSFHRCLL